jgi:hypothetical protein
MISKLLFTLASVATLASFARAADSPSSLLLFPEYNSNPGVFTVISVANTKTGPQGLPSAPAIRVHFVYIDGATCQETDRDEPMTPNDLVTVIAGFHNSASAKGFLYVYAIDAASGAAIKWDWLIGSQMQLDGITTFNYSYNPIGFKAGTAATADGQPTDADGDGVRDLNGVEYEKTWNEILIPSFFGQAGSRRSELVLINLSGRYEFLATANFTIYDDFENPFSAQYSWRCWVKVPLSRTAPFGDPVTGINNAFNNDFLAASGAGVIQGGGGLETGWMRIRGSTASSTATQISNPSIIAVLDETIGTFGMSDIPYLVDQTNIKGDLLAPAGPIGDTTQNP